MPEKKVQEYFYSNSDIRNSIRYQDGTLSFASFNLRNSKFEIIGSINYEVKLIDTNTPDENDGAKYNREEVCILLNNNSKIRYDWIYNRLIDPKLMYNMATTPLNANATYRYGTFRTSETNNVNINTIIYDKQDLPRKVTVSWD